MSESVGTSTGVPAPKARRWKEVKAAVERFAENRAAVVSAAVLLIIIVTAIIGPFVAPYDPNKIGTGPKLSPPSREFPMGTDQFGRDVFSRVLYGARLTIQASLIAVVVAAGVGIPLGLIAGYANRRVDNIVSRLSAGASTSCWRCRGSSSRSSSSRSSASG